MVCLVEEFFGFKNFEVFGCLMDWGWWCGFLEFRGEELFDDFVLFLLFCVWLGLVVLLFFLFELYFWFVVGIDFEVDVVVFLMVFVVCILVCVGVGIGVIDCGRV